MPEPLELYADDSAQEKEKIRGYLLSSGKAIEGLLKSLPTVAHIDVGIDADGPYLTAEAKLLGQRICRKSTRAATGRRTMRRGRGQKGWAAQG